MSQGWYSIHARGARQAEIWIYGDIGESWSEETVTARQFVADLAKVDADQLTVRINSVGGSVPDGLAIYNAIKRHPAQVTVAIDGVAMSVASLIAMAGDQIEMADNAMLMIHAPWSVAVGNASAMRETADTLDKWAEAMASSYATKSGMDKADVLALLTDGKDHYYTAEEAHAAGFADVIVDAMPIAASAAVPAAALARFSKASAARAAQPLEMPLMAESIAVAAAAQSAAPDAAAVLAAEKTRREAVRAQFAPFAGRDGMDVLARQCEDDHTVTAEAAGLKILAKLAEGVEPVAAAHVVTIEDEDDKRRSGAVATLLARAGVADKATRTAAQTAGMGGLKLLDLARGSLDRAGVKHRHMSQMEVVGAAFTQSTSDFPVLLENAMHKALQGAYAIAPDTWSRFCTTGSVSDFRAHHRYRLGSFGNLDPLTELAEYTNKTIPDGEKTSISIGTRGNIINLSRQAVINDDLGAFIGLAAMLGRAARRTIEDTVYDLLAENSGLGPTLGDGLTLFHANHGNIGTGAAISVAALDADRVLMATQTDISGNDFLDLRPSVLLIPIGLGGTARVINGAQYDPDTANKLQRPNMVNGLFSDIVDTPRLSGTRRYLFAEPSVAPVIEVAFLDGNQEPYIEQEMGFTVDGTRYKVRLDFGVAAIDYRGAVTNAGA